MLFDTAGVTRSLGGLLSVLKDRLFEFFGHRVLSQWQQMVTYLESYPVQVRTDGNAPKNVCESDIRDLSHGVSTKFLARAVSRSDQ